jgi:hypothetical protein
MGKARGKAFTMSFSSDNPQIINQVPQTINLPDIDEPELFQERLENLLRDMSNNVNGKIGGVYDLGEKCTSEQYFINGNPQKYRQVYRKTFDMVSINGGNIAPGGTVTTAHNISQVKESAKIWANCTSTTGRCFSLMNENIYVDATNVSFTNNTAFTLSQADVIVNILKES